MRVRFPSPAPVRIKDLQSSAVRCVFRRHRPAPHKSPSHAEPAKAILAPNVCGPVEGKRGEHQRVHHCFATHRRLGAAFGFEYHSLHSPRKLWLGSNLTAASIRLCLPTRIQCRKRPGRAITLRRLTGPWCCTQAAVTLPLPAMRSRSFARPTGIRCMHTSADADTRPKMRRI